MYYLILCSACSNLSTDDEDAVQYQDSESITNVLKTKIYATSEVLEENDNKLDVISEAGDIEPSMIISEEESYTPKVTSTTLKTDQPENIPQNQINNDTNQDLSNKSNDPLKFFIHETFDNDLGNGFKELFVALYAQNNTDFWCIFDAEKRFIEKLYTKEGFDYNGSKIEQYKYSTDSTTPFLPPGYIFGGYRWKIEEKTSNYFLLRFEIPKDSFPDYLTVSYRSSCIKDWNYTHETSIVRFNQTIKDLPSFEEQIDENIYQIGESIQINDTVILNFSNVIKVSDDEWIIPFMIENNHKGYAIYYEAYLGILTEEGFIFDVSLFSNYEDGVIYHYLSEEGDLFTPMDKRKWNRELGPSQSHQLVVRVKGLEPGRYLLNGDELKFSIMSPEEEDFEANILLDIYLN